VGLGLALAGVTLVPMAELVLRSQRRVPLPISERDRGSVGWSALSSGLGLSSGPSGTDYLGSLYAGPLMLCAAAAAFAERERRRLALLLGAVAVAGILAGMAAPPGPWLRALPFWTGSGIPPRPSPDLFRSPDAGGDWSGLAQVCSGQTARLAACRNRTGGLLLLLFSRQPPVARLSEAIGLAALVWLAAARTGQASGAPASPGARGAVLETVAALALTASLLIAARPSFRYAPESEVRRVPASIPFLARVSGRVLTPPPLALAGWVLRDARFDAATLRRQREALLGYTNLLSGVTTIRTASALPTETQERIAASIDATDPVRAGGAAAGRVLWSPFLPANLGLREVGEFSRAPLNPYRSRLSFVPGYRIEPDPARAWDRASRGELIGRARFLDREPSPRPVAGTKRPFRHRPDCRRSPRAGCRGRQLAEPAFSSCGSRLPRMEGRRGRASGPDSDGRRLPARGRAPAGSHRVEFRYRPSPSTPGRSCPLLALGALVVDAQPRRIARDCVTTLFETYGVFGAVSAGLFGLIVGSFLNVLAHRLPRGESVVSPGSHCPPAARESSRGTTSRWCRGFFSEGAAGRAARPSRLGTRCWS
jgi:hypothetical protein